MDIKSIRRLYDIKVILGIPASKHQIVCPLPQHSHSNYSPSFSVFHTKDGVQKFRCHGSCGLSGDAIDLIGYMKVSGYNPKDPEDIKRAVSLLQGNPVCPPKQYKPKTGLLTNDLADRYAIKEAAREYAHRRGLTDETIGYFKFGQFDTPSASWLTIPTFTGARLTMMKMRNIGDAGHKDRYRNLPGSIAGIFNVNEVRNRNGNTLILKAEIPAALLHQHGFLACAPNGGESSAEVDKQMYSELVFCKKRVVVGDNDPDPEVRKKMTAQAKRRADVFHADLRFPPEGFHDIDEWILAEPQHSIPTIRSWL